MTKYEVDRAKIGSVGVTGASYKFDLQVREVKVQGFTQWECRAFEYNREVTEPVVSWSDRGAITAMYTKLANQPIRDIVPMLVWGVSDEFEIE